MSKSTSRVPLRPVFKQSIFLIAAVLQIGCGIVFSSDLISEWQFEQFHAEVELVAVFALALGAALILRETFRLMRRNMRIERELGVATGAFQTVIEQHFDDWGLTAAERDVALLSIKGVSIVDIARMRDTREGTIKAQSTAIYRKVGVSSRAELVSVMVEELISGLQVTRA
jgi:DNA-binding NarL/FixJ family response regulator